MISWPAIRAIVYRRRWIFLSLTTMALLLGFVVTILQKPIYEASASIRFEIGGENIVEGDLQQSLTTFNFGQYLQTQKMVLASRRMAGVVYEALPLGVRAQLLQNQEFEGVPQNKLAAARRNAGMALLGDGISSSSPQGTLVLDITFASGDPKLAAAIANAYADNFIQADVQKSMEANQYALDYLKKQVDQVQREVQTAEFDANNFAKANGIVSQSMTGGTASSGSADDGSGAASGSGGGTLKGANLMNAGAAYANARTDRITAEQRWRSAANTPGRHLADVQQNPAYQTLAGQRSGAATKLADLEARYGPSYPAVRELKAQVAVIDRQMNAISDDVKQSLRNNYELLKRKEDALGEELGSASNATIQEQDRRVRYDAIERLADAKRRQLRVLMDRYNQISSASNVQPSTIRKLDDAQVPSGPSSPNLTKNLLIALALGIIGAIGVAALLEIFDDQVHADEEFERKLGLPILGLTPFVSSTSDNEGQSSNAIMEAYSSIRIAIDASLAADHKVIQVTSSQAAEGKSLTSRMLADRNANAGHKTLLIEADLRKPSLHNHFGQKRPQNGIVDILSGDKTPEEVFMAGTPNNLDVIPAGSLSTIGPITILSSPGFQQFIERSRSNYSRIIIDSPPVLGLGDSPLLSQYVDGTVFVAEANNVTVGQIRNALKRLRAANANVIGAILTKYKAADAGYGYGYGYDYYEYGNKDAS